MGRYITTLERIIKDAQARKILGLEVSKGVISNYHDDALPALHKILLDLAFGRKTVTELKLSTQIVEYAKQITGTETGPAEPPSRPPPTPTKKTKKAKTPVKVAPPKPSRQKHAVPADACPTLDKGRAFDVLYELKHLDVGQFANSVSVLMRLFLEISIRQYASKKRIPTTFVDPKNPLNGDGTEKKRKKDLKRLTADVIQDLINKEKYDAKALRITGQAIGQKANPFYIGLLNEYAHNNFQAPISTDLISIWNNNSEFFEAIWAEIS